jgi:hypothetical protein
MKQNNFKRNLLISSLVSLKPAKQQLLGKSHSGSDL